MAGLHLLPRQLVEAARYILEDLSLVAWRQTSMAVLVAALAVALT